MLRNVKFHVVQESLTVVEFAEMVLLALLDAKALQSKLKTVLVKDRPVRNHVPVTHKPHPMAISVLATKKTAVFGFFFLLVLSEKTSMIVCSSKTFSIKDSKIMLLVSKIFFGITENTGFPFQVEIFN